MNRIERCFQGLSEQGRKALIPYIMAGDPVPSVTVSIMHAMVDAGADIIELGVPFSDPMADGPVIQRAGERALVHHINLHQVMDMVREFRHIDNETPIVLMGYLNPIEIMGYATFANQAAKAGVDGVLTVDLPPEEADEYIPILYAAGLAPIFLLAPTTSGQRMKTINKVARGFVYYISIKGVTSASHLDVDEVAHKLAQIRGMTNLPIGVGFGIKDATSAARVAEVADAVVVGSAIVQKFEQYAHDSGNIAVEVASLITQMRTAMDQRTQALTK